MTTEKQPLIEPLAFWPAIICLILFIACGVISPELLGLILDTALLYISRDFGSLFMVATLATFFLLIILMLSKYGNIRIGGKDAKPDLTYWQWFSICLCSSIGAGILFWGLGEPIYHYVSPPEATGILPLTREAAVFGITQTAFHWTILQYAPYTLGGVAIAMTAYNSQKFSIANTLEGWLGSARAHGPIGQITNSIGMFTLCGSLGCVSALVILQVSAGLNVLFGIPENNFTRLIIITCLMGGFITSCVVGLRRGMQIVSDYNAKLYLIILVYVFVAGPTVFIMDMITTVFGSYMSTFWERATITNAMTTDLWPMNWTVMYWASYFVAAPFIGMFFARLAKGRTIRQFIVVSMVAPSIFAFIWTSMFGSLSMYLQSNGIIDVWAAIKANGMQHTVFQLFEALPLGTLFMGAFLLALIASYITYADPIASVLASMSSRTMNIEQEPNRFLKIIWGLGLGTMGYLLIMSGGVQSVRGFFTVCGFPVMFIMFFTTYSTCLTMGKEYRIQFPEAE